MQDLTTVAKQFGSPYYTLYRPDLIEVLASGLETTKIQFDANVIGLSRSYDGSFAVMTAAGPTEKADLLIGADGIHSRVRESTVGNVPARYSGMAAYRALVARERVADWESDVVRNWLGPYRHLVAYSVGRDGAYINIVAVVPAPEPTSEAWTELGSAADLRQHFRGWCPDVCDLLASVEDPVFRWGLFDREPLSAWSTNHSTLLGDASHPMLPFLAQGAAQAIGDAGSLVRCLDSYSEITEAVQHYERTRRPHTALVQRQSWSNNYMFHLPDGIEQEARDSRMANASSAEGLSALRWLFAMDPLDIQPEEMC